MFEIMVLVENIGYLIDNNGNSAFPLSGAARYKSHKRQDSRRILKIGDKNTAHMEV